MTPGWANIVTWILIFFGWYVVHRATLARDRRKEKREISTRLCTNLIELQSAAIDFHTGSHCDLRKSTDIAQQVENILIQLQTSPLSELNVPYAPRVALRQSITRQNIDPIGFVAQQPDSQIIMDIRNAITDMIFAIEDARESKWK